MNEKKYSFLVEDSQKERLDKYLARRLKVFSRTRIQSLIRDGMVSIDGLVPEKSGMVVENGLLIEVKVPEIVVASRLVAEDINLDIIFENDDLLVINKQSGLVVHPGPGHGSGTLVNAVLAHAPDLEGIGGERRPGIVHRLDKDTSGIILVAKNEVCHKWLVEQFKSRKVSKIYMTLVDGHPPTPQGLIDAPIGRDPTHRQQMAILPPGKGRSARTEYHQIERYARHTLIEAHPVTGRTHQIRLHMAFIGCPVVGDRVYGRAHPTVPIRRFFLHASSISFALPGEEKQQTFEAPIPEELKSILESLEK